jgi:hypothetical protein
MLTNKLPKERTLAYYKSAKVQLQETLANLITNNASIDSIAEITNAIKYSSRKIEQIEHKCLS